MSLCCVFSYIYKLQIVPSVLWHCWLDGRKGIRPVKTERWGAGVVICLERDADLHMAQLMPLPLTVSCFSKIQIDFTFLVPAHLGSLGEGPLNGCVCVIMLCDLIQSVLSVCITLCLERSVRCIILGTGTRKRRRSRHARHTSVLRNSRPSS